jgi:hypothetical protein
MATPSASTPNPFAMASPKLAILADSNVQDPKPATLKELVGCDYIIHRVSDMPTFLRFTAPEGSLNFMVVACLTPLIAEFAGTEDTDDREMALGNNSRN